MTFAPGDSLGIPEMEKIFKINQENIYNTGVAPWDINPEERGYVCFGVYDADPADQQGYVGRCWNPGTGTFICKRTGHGVNDPVDHNGNCNWEFVGTSTPGWDPAAGPRRCPG